jgi:hypothetical protein
MSAMKTWWLLLGMSLLFLGLGLAAVVAAVVTGEWALLGGLAAVAVGLVMLWGALRSRREQRLDEVAPPAPPSGTAPIAEVADALRERFAGTPYTVELQGSQIRVHADLADARFLTWAAAHHVKVVRGVDVVTPKPGVALMRDFEQDVDLSGSTGRLSGKARVFSGRSWSYERRVEVGVGTDGSVGRQVDVTFSSSDLHGPVLDVLAAKGYGAGWFATMPAEAKGALVVGAIGGIGGIAAGLVLGLQALLG